MLLSIMNKSRLLLSAFILFHLAAANAGYTIIASHCLTSQISSQSVVLSTTKDLSLFQIDNVGFKRLMAAKNSAKINCGGFLNVSDAWQENINHKLSTLDAKTFLKKYDQAFSPLYHPSIQYQIQYPQQVTKLMTHFIVTEMWGYLSNFSSFHERYANSDNGVKAAFWLKDKAERFVQESQRSDVVIKLINTGPAYKQPSLVVKVGSSTEPAIVVGAHMDTYDAKTESMPGADDDGSGTVTNLALLKAVLTSNIKFKRPIYFIWYAAEEEGLVGSQYVVSHFKNERIPVAAVLNMDMTGFSKSNDRTMWLINDFTDPALTNFLEQLINTYVKAPVKYTPCGYACSDHATWHINGFKAVMPFEAKLGEDNQYIHTPKDTMDLLSEAHMVNFAKLAIAFVGELAEPIV